MVSATTQVSRPVAVITYATVCSGIEAPSVAWEPLGDFEPVFFAEVAPFPKAVLAHHWPHVPNLGDFTKINGSNYVGRVDVLWGSTPCQSFSKAGLCEGLEDERGKLTLDFVKLANEINPEVAAWENVRNVLSITKNKKTNRVSNPFGEFLGALSGEGSVLQPPGGKWENAGCVLGPRRSIAWQVYDAAYSGLAARRERVYVIATPVGGADPADIIFERPGRSRDTGARQRPKVRQALVAPGTRSVVEAHFFNADASPKWASEIAYTLRADSGSGGLQGLAIRYSNGDVEAHETTNRQQERLLGFPADHTLIPWAGKGSLPLARRQAVGNSVAIPDVRWIGKRIKAALAERLTIDDAGALPKVA